MRCDLNEVLNSQLMPFIGRSVDVLIAGGVHFRGKLTYGHYYAVVDIEPTAAYPASTYALSPRDILTIETTDQPS